MTAVRNGIWPLVRVYTGKQGEPYARKGAGHDVNPNWMVEDEAGRFFTNKGGYTREDRWEAQHVHTWDATEVAKRFDLAAP